MVTRCYVRVFLVFEVLTLLTVVGSVIAQQPLKHYYCTCADTNFFEKLTNLIGSIHKNDFEHLGEVAVFDLGFTQQERNKLNNMQRVKVYQVELVHPELLKKFFVGGNKMVPGWYAWKPIAIKQALGLFPYILYVDAGNIILKPLDLIFKHIIEHEYFFFECLKNPLACVGPCLTKKARTLLEKIPQNRHEFILNKIQLVAGFQGLTRSMLKQYVYPMYKLAHDLTWFADDGSAPRGFGGARYDQVLFSIHAFDLGLLTHNNGWFNLSVGGKNYKMHIADPAGEEVNDQSIAYICRGCLKEFSQYVLYCKG
jgi:hypothetical protein